MSVIVFSIYVMKSEELSASFTTDPICLFIFYSGRKKKITNV